MKLNKKQKTDIINKCRKSFEYFCHNFCYVKHPNAGVIPFKLFDYQKKSIKLFNKHNRIIYRKCRQSGISTLTGAYVLWVGMFYANKKLLIVSKRDEDAKAYLDRNIKFVYENLPSWMHKIFGDPRATGARQYSPPVAYNDHTIEFFHGSEIKSLTSSKDTLRSNAATLVIIDEAAFIRDMDDMWAAGQPTLMHGGSVIVISTCNGKGNWYHHTWEGAEANENGFYPILIPWWDMDWTIEWEDDLSGKRVTLSPTKDIEKCESEEDKLIYGPYKSPWLIQQRRELQESGESWKFRQEILMDFIGSGNTVLEIPNLIKLEEQKDDNYKRMTKPVKYSNDNANISNLILDFQGLLWVWNIPIRKTPDVVENGRILKPGNPGHRYVIGADISSGEDNDYSVAQIIDVTTKEQVAELRIKCDTSYFAKMLDYLGRTYNNALLVPENTGIGKPLSQDLKNVYYYPNLFHRRLPSGKKDSKPGFPTTNSSKPEIVKAITDNIGIDVSDGGILFKSSRLIREANIFIHLGNGRVGNEPGSNNNDDVIIASGLACLGMIDAMSTPDGLIPTNSQHVASHADNKIDLTMDDVLTKGGRKLMYPIKVESNSTVNMSMEDELNSFISQMGGGVTLEDRKSALKASKYKSDPFKKY